MYDSEIVFHYFLRKALQSSVSLTAIKLELMTYFAHGWHLAINRKPLINDPIKAWRHGPVIESLHHKYNRKEVKLGKSLKDGLVRQVRDIDAFFLDSVWSQYKNMIDVEMIDLCHKDNTPWGTIYEKSSRDITIQNRIIAQHYLWLQATQPHYTGISSLSPKLHKTG